MSKRNTESDSWGQLLSDFGIEDKTPAESVETVEVRNSKAGVVESGVAEVGNAERGNAERGSAELGDAGVGISGTSVSKAELADESSESSETKEKKSIFSRFPKINFFGAPPETSLDSVIEDVKSPSLGGRAFTDNKLEKMPLSQEWADRQEKGVADSSVTDSPVADGSDAFSAVASQIDALASREAPSIRSGERSARRQVTSMFDDPVPESEEFRALKDIMGEPPPPSQEERVRGETRRDVFVEEEADTWQRGRGRGRPKPQPREERRDEREVRGRNTRYRPPVEVDDLPETPFEPIDDDMPKTRGRGRRGSRYAGESRHSGESRYAGDHYRDREPVQDDLPQEEWSEVDAALQGRNEPVQRGGRRQRNDKRRGSERAERQEQPGRQERPAFDREPSDREESSIVAVHGNVPSWDEAIGDIIASNIARHKSHSGRGRR